MDQNRDPANQVQADDQIESSGHRLTGSPAAKGDWHDGHAVESGFRHLFCIHLENKDEFGYNRDMKETVCLVSLGCPKNLVDSEVMLGLLSKEGIPLPETLRRLKF